MASLIEYQTKIHENDYINLPILFLISPVKENRKPISHYSYLYSKKRITQNKINNKTLLIDATKMKYLTDFHLHAWGSSFSCCHCRQGDDGGPIHESKTLKMPLVESTCQLHAFLGDNINREGTTAPPPRPPNEKREGVVTEIVLCVCFSIYGNRCTVVIIRESGILRVIWCKYKGNLFYTDL